jgi:hypothetical protein
MHLKVMVGSLRRQNAKLLGMWHRCPHVYLREPVEKALAGAIVATKGSLSRCRREDHGSEVLAIVPDMEASVDWVISVHESISAVKTRVVSTPRWEPNSKGFNIMASEGRTASHSNGSGHTGEKRRATEDGQVLP